MNVVYDPVVLRDLKAKLDLLCREQGIVEPSARETLVRNLFAGWSTHIVAELVGPPATDCAQA